MGSEDIDDYLSSGPMEDMDYMGSQNVAVFVKPPSDFVKNKFNISDTHINDNKNMTVKNNVPFNTEQRSNLSHSFSNQSDTNHYRIKDGPNMIPAPPENINSSTTENSLLFTTLNSRPPGSSALTVLDYLLVDDKLVGKTIKKMSEMLDTYFSDWRG
eukprot:TRINITY_DN53753_c0_g1_i1.p1 TRINITY_DN53753_c0_g1~~TRINITY_DN53753_c0_g1_i1.p1  ORF type:complete len:157 (+),score=21.94 TRINITY_DN53753_c0_g1_i1:1-471(+)